MVLPAVQKVLKSTDGMEIFTEASGDRSNPHVILIHALSLSGAVFDEFCQRVDVLDSLYVVRADLRGHGRSGKPLTPEGHLSYLYADDVEVVIEAYRLLKPVYAGWSLGGMIASDICEYLGPDAISGIFYLSSLATVKDVSMGGVPQLVLDLFGRMKDPADIPQAMVEFADSCFVSDVPKSVPYPLRCMWYGMGASQPQVCRVLTTSRDQYTEPLWKAVKEGLPACVVHGTGDVMCQPHFLEDRMKAAPAKDLEVVMIPGVGHALIWEEPNRVAEALIGFARKVWRDA